MIDLKQTTETVCGIAARCGDFLRQERRKFNRSCVQEKNSHDYVSYVDKASEAILVNELSALLPGAGFMTEEGSVAYHDEACYWVIDPLDGTTNYIHDNAPYCISIALRCNGELLIGVVYEVCRSECFYAWKGGGAWLDGNHIHVSDVKELTNAFIVTELPYNSDTYHDTALHLLDKLYGNVAGIRMNGSAATAICYVAAGRFDLWLEAFVQPWDYAAAALIVQEAGGTVTNYYGADDFFGGHHVIAGNGHLNKFFLDLVAEALPVGMAPEQSSNA